MVTIVIRGPNLAGNRVPSQATNDDVSRPMEERMECCNWRQKVPRVHRCPPLISNLATHSFLGATCYLVLFAGVSIGRKGKTFVQTGHTIHTG